jgi:hypothetical protein
VEDTAVLIGVVKRHWLEWSNDRLLYKTEVRLLKTEHPEHRLRRKEKSVDQGLRRKGPNHVLTSFRRKRWADTLEELGRFDEAQGLRRQHLDACRQNVGPGFSLTQSISCSMSR